MFRRLCLARPHALRKRRRFGFGRPAEHIAIAHSSLGCTAWQHVARQCTAAAYAAQTAAARSVGGGLVVFPLTIANGTALCMGVAAFDSVAYLHVQASESPHGRPIREASASMAPLTCATGDGVAATQCGTAHGVAMPMR
jgi:hypothetical protein